jgi:hypothetical protein
MAYPYYQAYPGYNPMYYQQLQNTQQQQQTVQQTPQIQNGGFVMVKDINEAMNYAVAPGNSVTFKVESQPYICTKTLGFSQLDQPIFEVFKLVKEDKQWQESTAESASVVEYLSVDEANSIKAEISSLRAEIDSIKKCIETPTKEVKADDGYQSTVQCVHTADAKSKSDITET